MTENKHLNTYQKSYLLHDLMNSRVSKLLIGFLLISANLWIVAASIKFLINI